MDRDKVKRGALLPAQYQGGNSLSIIGELPIAWSAREARLYNRIGAMDQSKVPGNLVKREDNARRIN